VYHIELEGGNSHLIDGRSGQEEKITEQRAIAIARTKLPSNVGVSKTEVLTEHTAEYSWGPLPVYRVVFDDRHATVVFVSTLNGAERSVNRLNRIQDFVEGLHTFRTVDLVTDSESVRKGLVVVFSLIGVGAAGSGYYLAWRRR
jgi:hypothetical protein